MATTPWYALPVTQGFYWTRTNTHAHSGIDLGTAPGEPITAPAAGVQLSEGTEPWGGQENELVQDTSGHYQVLTWLHMSGETPLQPGTPIHKGELLGYSGTPPPGYGNGPHIHVEETAGKVAPYMGYNPWFPTSTSYPINPQPMLTSLRSGANPLSSTYTPALDAVSLGIPGSDPLGLGAGLTNVSKVMQAGVRDVESGVADMFKRAGVFVIGAILAVVGFFIIFQPMIKETAKIPEKLGKEVLGGGSSPLDEAEAAGPKVKRAPKAASNKASEGEPIFMGKQRIGSMQNGKMVFERSGAAKVAEAVA